MFIRLYDVTYVETQLNPFMYNVEKRPNVLQNSYGVKILYKIMVYNILKLCLAIFQYYA